MDFDTHLSLVQGCLTHVKRVFGPLDQLTLAKDVDVMKDILKKVEACISNFSENQVEEAYLFLLLNSSFGLDDGNLQQSDLSHMIGIAPIISKDVFIALSVEVFCLQNFVFETFSAMPYPLSSELYKTLISLYVKHDFMKVADKLDLFILALYNHVLMYEGKEKNSISWILLDVLLDEITNISRSISLNISCNIPTQLRKVAPITYDFPTQLRKVASITYDFPTYLKILKATLSILKSTFKKETPVAPQIWKNVLGIQTETEECAPHYYHKVQGMILEYVTWICTYIPGMPFLDTFGEYQYPSLIKPVRELAYDCAAELKSQAPSCVHLIGELESISLKPYCVYDDIAESTPMIKCNNALIESDNQHLWLKALIHEPSAWVNEEVLRTLHELLDKITPEDKVYICLTFLSYKERRTDSLRDLIVKCYCKLSTDSKLHLLNNRIEICQNETLFLNGNSESCILEVLNRLVAQGEADSEMDQLIVQAYICPELVVKHVVFTAASNKPFSESVVGKIIQILKPVFVCPADTPSQSINLTDVILSDLIFNTNEINKELEGLQNLVDLLFEVDLLNKESFLHSCILPPLFTAVYQRKQCTVVLLLQILLNFQSNVPLYESNAQIATLLVFLGQLLEWFSRSADVSAQSEGSAVREITIRNISQILGVPNCVKSIEDKDREWMLDELSVLSPENRHYFSVFVPEWMLFHGKVGGHVVITLAVVLPSLHLSEWHTLIELLANVNEGNKFESVLTFSSAVRVLIRSTTFKEQAKFHQLSKGCARNLGSVIQAFVKSGIEPRQSPRIFEELLTLLELFPKSEQFDVAVFLLPTMTQIVDQGNQHTDVLTTLGTLLLKTSVKCVRRDLGRHLKKLCSTVVCSNGNCV